MPAHSKPKIQKACEFCSSPFGVWPSQSHARFCSRTCYLDSRAATPKPDRTRVPAGRTGRPRKSKDTERTCPVCNTGFTLPEWDPKVYCSVPCATEGRRGRGRSRGRQLNAICPICDGPYSYYLSTPRKTCSQRCAGILKRKTPHGDVRRMSEVESAWLAGLFDGEGSIVITQRGRANLRSISYRIALYNTYRPLIDQIVKVTGYNNVKVKESANPRHATAYYWVCGGADAIAVLRQIRPWLIVKAERADAVFAGKAFDRQSRWDDIYPTEPVT